MSYAIATVLVGIVVWFFLAAAELFREGKNGAVNTETGENTATPEEIVEVSVEDFDNYFDRSAGRYCEHCGIHGSHHTDRHNDYALLVKSKIS